jgi:hypothetical protein
MIWVIIILLNWNIPYHDTQYKDVKMEFEIAIRELHRDTETPDSLIYIPWADTLNNTHCNTGFVAKIVNISDKSGEHGWRPRMP